MTRPGAPFPVPALPTGTLAGLTTLLDVLPDTVAFVKDVQGRYLYANRTLISRLRLDSPSALIGRLAQDVFPGGLGTTYTRQDTQVLAGHDLTEHLELHLYPGGQTGWCLTTKRALTGEGRLTGLVGLSRDLALPAPHASALAAAMTRLHADYAQPLGVADLARSAGLSVSAFERQTRRVYGLTPTQLLTRVRVDAATELLRSTDLPVARVAVECGYFDHSAFTRAFRAAVGLTPSRYRAYVRGG
ncbi:MULTISPECIES: AraC family transcriptional regulator [Deinococcus]|uniref:AraC family transcriptional regulator n=1 Tax=Deinococcus rufus TaxID=2136097 RepID=A0ABV7ZEF8_9DEIO|nr:AraC family transcriptional regulator [Deinococcus sp. AB2017081]WQE94323.1 AraC family transcriptional regulator [Deinococcus sp. AB2017081]